MCCHRMGICADAVFLYGTSLYLMRLTLDLDTWPSMIEMAIRLFGTGGSIRNFRALPDCSLIGQKQGKQNNIVHVYTKKN